MVAPTGTKARLLAHLTLAEMDLRSLGYLWVPTWDNANVNYADADTYDRAMKRLAAAIRLVEGGRE